MTTPRLMLDLAALRARLDALPLDRAPLRRAGLLAILLVVLLVAGKAFGPDRSAATAPASRQEVRAETENGSATRQAAPSGWTAGRVFALLLLAGGAGGAFLLHRRSAPAASASAALDVIETHTLGPGQTLQLLACGDDVLLLSATPDAIRLLRTWPRDRFDRDAVSFADALASAGGTVDAASEDADEPEPSAIENDLDETRLAALAGTDPAEVGPIHIDPATDLVQDSPPPDHASEGASQQGELEGVAWTERHAHPSTTPDPSPGGGLVPRRTVSDSLKLATPPQSQGSPRRERFVSPPPRLLEERPGREWVHDQAQVQENPADGAPAPLAEAMAEPVRQPPAAAERPTLGTPPAALAAPMLRQFQPADA